MAGKGDRSVAGMMRPMVLVVSLRSALAAELA